MLYVQSRNSYVLSPPFIRIIVRYVVYSTKIYNHRAIRSLEHENITYHRGDHSVWIWVWGLGVGGWGRVWVLDGLTVWRVTQVVEAFSTVYMPTGSPRGESS